MAGEAGNIDRLMPSAPAPDRFNAFIEGVTRNGRAGGPLSGMRFAAKDCLDLTGRAPGCGLAARSPVSPPRADAAVIARLTEAGADLVAMAQMTALAYEPSGHNATLGRPLNPRDEGYVCGGSSSGSAVAVAAGLVDFAIGTDTAGSVRIPAHCCGVPAWKPTNGLIDLAGVMPLAGSLDTVGFFGATPDVLARLAPVLSAKPVAPFRSVRLAADALAESAPAVKAAVEGAVTAIDLPSSTVDLMPLIRSCDPPVLTLLQGEAYRAHRALIEGGGLDPVLASRFIKGAAITDDDLVTARQKLETLHDEALETVLGPDSVLILPVMPCETPRVGQCEPGSPDFSPRALYALSAFTRFANGLGLPVVTLPVGVDSNGMPVSVQLVARRGRDADLIAFACQYAARLPKPPVAEVPRP